MRMAAPDSSAPAIAPKSVVASVVASTRPVVASVVASREKPRTATTKRAPTPVVASAKVPAPHATTDRPGLVWRIEINRRPKADGSYSYHWLYRFGSGDKRRSVYGGTIDQLIAFNPTRWQKYLEVTNGKQKHKK
ncbi:protein of unknown function [Candidatus Promineifilum breve]|uniref:Uncharacterized protein n=1 Tax=Candidatus Promineifilum breve TaxID=1806508 RepID=A0A160T588_9CHLR|nr:protein of unknown function [Candidatus Promineifilum breve]